ncbi:MAG: right-handed parallel beta-helix repeat-containing protein [Planctomycetota bacterium]|nr:right-handed parallel beta-helix repeat-containing protein [Planctomycetota bacterium]
MLMLTAWRTSEVFLLSALPLLIGQNPELVPSRDDFKITSDARIKPGTYDIADAAGDGAIQIIGDGITVDFQGAELVGAADSVRADKYAGKGIVIRGRNVTVKNARVRGYKVGIYAEDCPNLSVIGCDVSCNYRQHLGSTLEREDVSDWLYGHENDDNEWLRYGAGIYLYRCRGAKLIGNRARKGQNGICICRCDDSVIVDNDMSFLSGWGIAMWRSSRCDVSHNKCDWCVRGYSHGVYRRGQDSAGIFVYEQCSDNVFAFNSATHGGDGFFLYAGNETTQKTGQGGCNRNVLYRNDFSHAVANGIEATFSDGNMFIENRLDECEHGVWAGYSYNTLIAGNQMGDCVNGISIEHGRNNIIVENTITDTRLGVHLWWDDDKDLLASAFGQARNGCPSTGNRVLANSFRGVERAVRLASDTNTIVRWNRMSNVREALAVDGTIVGVHFANNATGGAALPLIAPQGSTIEQNESADGYEKPAALEQLAERIPPKTQGALDALLPKGHLRGRQYIIVDEWGPWDLRETRVFPTHIAGGHRASFQVLGQAGSYKVLKVEGGVDVSPREGVLPGRFSVTPSKPGVHEFEVELEVGGKPMSVSGTVMRSDWTVRFYAWNPANDPREDEQSWRDLIGKPALQELVLPSLDFIWGVRAPSTNVPRDHFGTVATTSIVLPAGKWLVRTISDDGIRVWVDQRLIIDDWTWHAPKENATTIELQAGEHEFRVEHFEIDGYAQLQLTLEPR